MSLRCWFVVFGAMAPIPVSLFLASCNEPTTCTVGTERCMCYGNGTCEDGLACLSEHCVDPTPDLDAGADARSLASESLAGEETIDGSAQTTKDVPPSTDDSRDLTTTGVTTVDSSAGSAQTTLDATYSHPVSSNASSEAQTGVDADSSLHATTSVETTSSTDATSGSDHTTEDEPTFAVLPARLSNALDEPATTVTPTADCAADLHPEEVCYAAAICDGEPCAATLEWIAATGTVASAGYWFQLRDLSGDGTVLFGDWVQEAGTPRYVALLRWGNDRVTLFDDAESTGTAINFDATAAVGAVNVANDWEYVRWRSGGNDPLAIGIGTPYGISRGNTVVGNTRVEGVMRGFTWTTAEPTFVQNLVLQTISGDGYYAAGLTDGGGPVVLFHANGTKTIPATPQLRPDVTSDVNFDGSVVVGYGWSQQALSSPMYRWRVEEEQVDIIAPLPGFQSAIPLAVTDDGNVIVGTNQNGSTYGPIEDTEAFYWDGEEGMRPMVDELLQRGLSLTSDLWLSTARISADGSTVVGEGYEGTSRILWRARLAR